MHQILYTSAAHKDLTESDIDQILMNARRNNELHGLTGVLIYKSGVFCQLLEGDHADITKVYGKICQDTRHTNITTLYSSSADERIFKDWSMAFRRLEDFDEDLMAKINLLIKMVNPKDEKLSSHKITQILKGIKFTL